MDDGGTCGGTCAAGVWGDTSAGTWVVGDGGVVLASILGVATGAMTGAVSEGEEAGTDDTLVGTLVGGA